MRLELIKQFTNSTSLSVELRVPEGIVTQVLAADGVNIEGKSCSPWTFEFYRIDRDHV